MVCPTVYAEDSRFEAIELSADYVGAALLLSGLYGTVFYEDNYEGFIQLAETVIAAQLVAEGLKLVVDKERPNGGCCESFPSGHTTLAFSSAGFIHQRYGIAYGAPAYLGAAYVAWSRFELDKHDQIDIAAGALIGLLSSYIFTTSYEHVDVGPMVTEDGFGMYANFLW